MDVMNMDVLLNQYHIPIRTQEFLVPTIVGFITEFLFYSSQGFIKLFQKKEKSLSFGKALLCIVFGLSILLTPSFILSGHNSISTVQIRIFLPDTKKLVTI
jgi:hypothetical protein